MPGSNAPRNQQRPAKSPVKSRPQRGPRGGLGWLFLFAAGGGLLALFVFAPQVLRDVFAPPPVPNQLGDQPTSAQDQDADLLTRDVAIEGRTLSGDATDLAQRPIEEDVPTDLPVAEPEPEEFRDALRGQDILGRAEDAYANYRWDEARSLATSIRDLEVDPALRTRAQDIVEGTRRLSELFETLGTRDELVRNLETHPSSVEVLLRGSPTQVIPVVSLGDNKPVEVGDPVSYVRDRLSGAGEVPVLMTNNIATTLSAADVSEVRSANIQQIIDERRTLMNERVAMFEDDIDMRNDPMAWYEAAKFAYRNRIDDQVVELLDRALLLSPDLGQAIREDTAQDWFTRLVMAIDEGNRAAAGGFMRQLRRYEDTLAFPQAIAYYEGNMDALRQARQEAVAQQQQQRQAARERRLERAQTLGDEEEVATIEQEVVQERTRREERAARGATGDIASANASFDKGMAIYQAAQAMGATRERDQKYRDARVHFRAALDIYAAAVEAGDRSVEQRMIQANQLQYACMKYARAF